ncbi:MAG: DUF1778 domain-containing protein [Nevskia sp.]|nr:DUF1778 domain-containing protein [Nevskia sp.]
MTKSARLETRISPATQALLKRAAEIQGRSVSDFVVTAVQEAAQKAIAEVEVIRLSRKAQEHIAAQLLNPPVPTPALARAFKRHRALVVE